MAEGPVPLDLLRAVLEPVRLAVLAQAARGEVSIDTLTADLGVPRKAVAKAVGDLRASGILRADGSLNSEGLVELARMLPQEHSDLGEPVSGPWTDDEARMLGRFFANGQLVELPTSASKRRLVLEKIAQEFEPGVRYAERDLNFKIQLIYPDYAAIRRYMIEEGLMDRADGAYWRTGGRYEAPRGIVEEQPAIETENPNIVLRPYTLGMVDDIVSAANHPEIAHYMGDRFPYPYTREDGEVWLAIATSNDPTQAYAVFYEAEFVGGIGYVPRDAELSGTVEMGWWLTPSAWHKGILAIAGRALRDELFIHRSVMRIEAPIMHANPNSGRVAEKIGMVQEGVAPSRYVKRGVRYDQITYGITRDRWESLGSA